MAERPPAAAAVMLSKSRKQKVIMLISFRYCNKPSYDPSGRVVTRYNGENLHKHRLSDRISRAIKVEGRSVRGGERWRRCSGRRRSGRTPGTVVAAPWPRLPRPRIWFGAALLTSPLRSEAKATGRGEAMDRGTVRPQGKRENGVMGYRCDSERLTTRCTVVIALRGFSKLLSDVKDFKPVESLAT